MFAHYLLLYIFWCSDCWRDCKLCIICICSSNSCYPSRCIKHYCQVIPPTPSLDGTSSFTEFSFSSFSSCFQLWCFEWCAQCYLGSLHVEGEVTPARGFRMCYVYFWFSHNRYPCTTRESYNFCPWDMDYGYRTRLVFTFDHFSLLSICVKAFEWLYFHSISAFLLYLGSVIVLVFLLIFHFAPSCGHTNVLVFTGICSLMGSLSVHIWTTLMDLKFILLLTTGLFPFSLHCPLWVEFH